MTDLFLVIAVGIASIGDLDLHPFQGHAKIKELKEINNEFVSIEKSAVFSSQKECDQYLIDRFNSEPTAMEPKENRNLSFNENLPFNGRLVYSHEVFEGAGAYRAYFCEKLVTDFQQKERSEVLKQVEELIEKKLNDSMNEEDTSTFETHSYKFPEMFSFNLGGSGALVEFELEVSTQFHETVIKNVEKYRTPLRETVLETLAETASVSKRWESSTNFNAWEGFSIVMRARLNRKLEELEGFGGIENVFFPYFKIIEAD